MIRSDNNDTNWSSALKVNADGTTTGQFFPRITVDQTSGKVAVSWYDCRADTVNNRKTQFYAAVSSDGGTSFSSNNLLLNPVQSDTWLVDDLDHLPCTIGWDGSRDYFDYTGLAFYGGYFYSAWADNSNATTNNPDCVYGMDIYVARVRY